MSIQRIERPDPARAHLGDLPESGYGVPIMQSVFQEIEGRREGGRFCLELKLRTENSELKT